MTTTGKAIFIDRDGTLNAMVYDETHGLLDSPRRPEQVSIIPGAGRFLREMRLMGFKIIVVTNQPGLAKGTLTIEELNRVNDKLLHLLRLEGGEWDDLRYCPHHPEGQPQARNEFIKSCECRKPKPGMLLAAANDFNLNLSNCWMVGDGIVDVQAGHAAGCNAIFVTRLKPEQLVLLTDYGIDNPKFLAKNLVEAANIIKSHKK